MKVCEFCNFRFPNIESSCPACGNPLIEIALDQLACCPKANCAETIVSNSGQYCSQCGTKLELVSPELWLRKFVEPAFEKDLTGVLTNRDELLRTATRIGLPQDEAEQYFEQAFRTKAGASFAEVGTWTQEVIELLNQKDNHTPDVRQYAEVSATKLGIFPAVTKRLLDGFGPVADGSAEPVTSQRVSVKTSVGNSQQTGKGDGPIAPRKLTRKRTSVAGDPIRNSAKSFYGRLVAGGSVTNNLTYLNTVKSASKQGVLDRQGSLIEVGNQGTFVLFENGDSGWMFPNPALVFSSKDLASLFPTLTIDQYYKDKQSIEPVRVIRVGNGRWKALPSQNGSSSTQAPAAATKKDAPAKTLAPAISTPETKNKIKPLLIGSIIVVLCGLFAAFTIWKTLTSSRGDPVDENLSMKFVAGTSFTMGNNKAEENERPQHSVTVKPFSIDTYEVTREDYEKFVKTTSHRAPSGWVNGHYPPNTGKWPATGVDWFDADAYCKWMGKRLPTEEEWELAARGSDGRKYPWGNEWQAGYANAENAASTLTDVHRFNGASPYGVIGMVGNAWEWTSSKLGPYPGGRIPPDELGNGQDDLRIIRGGSWESKRTSATTSYRWGWPASGGSNYANTGFRCVKDP